MILSRFLMFVVFFSCGIESTFANNTDTLNSSMTITEDTAIYTALTDEKVAKLKKKNGVDNFFTIADDQQTYLSQADEYLAERKIKTLNLKSDQTLVFPNNLTIKTKDIPAWSYILFRKGAAPVIAPPIDVVDATKKLFNSKPPVIAQEPKNAKLYSSYVADLNEDGIADKIMVYRKKEAMLDQVYDLSFSIMKGVGNNKFINWSKNSEILDYPENGCSGHGLKNIAVKNSFFTIEYQSCADRAIYNFYTTFKYSKSLDRFELYKNNRVKVVNGQEVKKVEVCPLTEKFYFDNFGGQCS